MARILVVDDDEMTFLKADADRTGGRVLADVLEGLLHDAQDDRLLCLRQPHGRGTELDPDLQTGERRHSCDGVADRPVETELIEHGRPELTDERAD